MQFFCECFSYDTHTLSVHVCVYVSVVSEMTDERFTSIFEQSVLAFLSVEAMLFFKSLRDRAEIACVTPVAEKLQVRGKM